MIYWPLIESSLGIVGACLPLYRPLADIHFIQSTVRCIKYIFSHKDIERFSLNSQPSRSLGLGIEDVAEKKENSSDDGSLRACDNS